MSRILGVLATIGFTASAVIHVLSYAGYTIAESLPTNLLLHAGVIVVWIPTIFKLNSARRPDEGLTYLLESVPAWTIPVVFIAGQLIAVSGLIATFVEPVVEDRSVSAVWMLFYGCAAIVFLFLAPKIDAERELTSSAP